MFGQNKNVRASLKIARLFGVPVFLHGSFAIVPIAVFYLWKQEGTGTGGLLWLSLFATCLFLSILLHEYGHVLVARRFGAKTKDIILLPIGGLARLEKLPARPHHELLVAMAGPAVNLGIALLLAPHFFFVFMKNFEVNALPFPETISEDFTFFLPMLFGLNILLALFNLMPAFPMDGGRILRALLCMKISRLKATWVAAALGQFIAAGMVVFAIARARPSYTLIGAFIYFTARQEYQWAKTESILKKHSVGEACHMAVACVPDNEIWGKFQEQKEKGEAGIHFVFDHSKKLVGWLPGHETGEKETFRFDMPVGKIARPIRGRIQIGEDLKKAHEKIQSGKEGQLVVMDNGSAIGILESWMVWEHLGKTGKGRG